MIKFLTAHCPRCSVLQKKMDAAAIKYEIIEDEETIKSYGIDFVPALVIDNEILDFSAAIKWVNNYTGGTE